MLEDYKQKFGVSGAMISAVDLLKGIAVGSDMDNIEVEGANGGLHTNYTGKMESAVKALLEDNYDFVYIHVEAPDEMGHQGNVDHKIRSIEYLDSRIIGPVVQAMDASAEDYRVLILPDHPTPIRCRTHTSAPVPYILFDSTEKKQTGVCYSEEAAAATGIYESQGYRLMEKFLKIGGK